MVLAAKLRQFAFHKHSPRRLNGLSFKKRQLLVLIPTSFVGSQYVMPFTHNDIKDVVHSHYLLIDR